MAKAKEDLRSLITTEKKRMLLEKSEDLFRYRMQFTTGQLGQTHLLRTTKRAIAKLKTLIREEELKDEQAKDK